MLETIIPLLIWAFSLVTTLILYAEDKNKETGLFYLITVGCSLVWIIFLPLGWYLHKKRIKEDYKQQKKRNWFWEIMAQALFGWYILMSFIGILILSFLDTLQY